MLARDTLLNALPEFRMIVAAICRLIGESSEQLELIVRILLFDFHLTHFTLPLLFSNFSSYFVSSARSSLSR